MISELSANARISFRDPSRRIHLSSNPTADRVRRLQKAGVMHASCVDRSQLGFAVEVDIDVKMQPQAKAQSFEAALRRVAGVVSAAIVTGDSDLRLRAACKDQSDLVGVIEALRNEASGQQTSSALICREIAVNNTVV